MVRATLSAVFILLLAVSSDATERRLPDFFNQSVKPCDNLHDHVCANKPELHEAQAIKSEGLLTAITKLLHGKRSEGFEKILKAAVIETTRRDRDKKFCRLKKVHLQKADFADRSNDRAIGKAFGNMIAFGRFLPGEIEQSRKPTKDVKVFRTINETHTVYHFDEVVSHGYIHEVGSLKEIKNKFVRGIFEGYFEELPEMRFGETPGKVAFRYVNRDANYFKETIVEPTYWEKNFELKAIADRIHETKLDSEYDRYTKLLVDHNLFAGYGNVLFAHTMYTHEAQLNPGVANDFDLLKQRILDEIRGHVAKATWMSDAARNDILEYLNKNEIIVGIDKKHQNVTLLKEMLDVYEEHFAKVDPSAECGLEMLARAHGLARHKLIYSNKGSLVPSLAQLQYERSILANSAHHIDSSIHVLPGFLHILNNYKLSTGFKYGYVGWAVAHEIFHGLGIRRGRTAKLPHLQGVVDTTHFVDEFDCYLYFIGERQFCMKYKDSQECPNIFSKVDEVFSDIEATRIVFPLLLEALDGKPVRNRRDAKDSEKLPLFDWRPPGVPEEEVLMSAAGYSEQQWFFLAQQFFACTSSDEMDQLYDDEHPRAQVRTNMIAQQIAGFTKAFGCKKTHRNYLRNKQCAVYPPKDPRPEDDERDAAKLATEPDINADVDVKTMETRSSSKASWNALFVLAFMFLPFACIM